MYLTISYLFVCLPTLELTKFKQHMCSIKISYANALSLGTNICKKKGTWSLWTSYIKQASSVGVTLTVVGWNNSSAICIASSESCEPKRFVRCRNKVEIYIQEQQPNQLHCYKQNMGFVNRMDQHVTKYWYPNEKIVVFPACLNGVCLLFRVNGYCVVLTKIKTMNLASSSFSKTCCQCNFSEIFKGR